MTNNEAIRRIKEYAAKWGVGYLPKEPSPFAGSSGPGAWSIADWEYSPAIYQKNLSTSYGREWPFLMHELAHAVCPYHPSMLDELEETTGFELLSICHLSLPMSDWDRWQSNFSVWRAIGCVYAETWENAPPSWRKMEMIDACHRARERRHFDYETSEPSFKIYRFDEDGGYFELPKAA